MTEKRSNGKSKTALNVGEMIEKVEGLAQGKLVKLDDRALENHDNKSDTLSVTDLYDILIRKIEEEGSQLLRVRFIKTTNFKKYCTILDENGQLVTLSEESVKDIITAFMVQQPAKCYRAMSKKNDVDNFFRYWINTPAGIGQTISEDDIASIRFLSQPGYCWARLPFDFDDTLIADDLPELCPTWWRIIEGMSNRKAFLEWIGSLFCDKADKSQYVWLYGEGRNGKSSITNTLMRLLDNTAVSSRASRNDVGRFWSQRLIGKRLCIFNDTNESRFPRSGYFKELTGDTYKDVEQKNRNDLIRIRLNAKFIFTSNKVLDIDGEVSDMRRAIFCHLPPVQESDISGNPNFLENLYLEAKNLVGVTVSMYRNRTYPFSAIEIDKEVTEQLLAINTAYYEDLIDRFLIIGEESLMPAAHMELLFRRIGMHGQSHSSTQARRNFREYLHRKYGIPTSSSLVSRSGVKFKAYEGLEFNENFEAK